MAQIMGERTRLLRFGRVAGKAPAPAGGRQQAGEGAQQRGFPGTIVAGDNQGKAIFQSKTKIFDQQSAAAADVEALAACRQGRKTSSLVQDVQACHGVNWPVVCVQGGSLGLGSIFWPDVLARC